MKYNVFVSKFTKKTTGGFTLIELLVIVLIVGILAAMALPQYQHAVTRSRYPQLQVAARAVHDAAQRYHLANDGWPAAFTDLDMSIRGDLDETGTNLTFGSYSCDYYPEEGWDAPSVLCYTTKGPYLGFRLFHDSEEQYCLAPRDQEWSAAFCESIGGVPTEVPAVANLMQYALP